MSELKACPFCGSPDERAHTTDCYLWHIVLGARPGDSDIRDKYNTRPIEDALRTENERLTAELARLREELKNTDNLLKEATETIGAVVACCTYNSNEDAKIGIYGIDQKAFTKIDQFITHYNDAVSAGKVSVDAKSVKRDLSDAEIEELGAQEAEKRGEK